MREKERKKERGREAHKGRVALFVKLPKDIDENVQPAGSEGKREREKGRESETR